MTVGFAGRRTSFHIALTLLSVVAIASVGACGSSGDTTLAEAGGGGGVDSNEAGGEATDAGGTVPFTEDASSQPGDDGGASSSDGGNDFDAAVCGYPYMCPMNKDLGTISGDTSPAGGNDVTASGSTSDWLTVRVTEDDHSALGKALGIRATLVSAAGTNFDMYLYQNDGSTTPECKVVAAQSSEPAGADDKLSLSWGEGSVANAGDDSETITVRVQHISGPCDAAHAWSLTVVGNAQ